MNDLSDWEERVLAGDFSAVPDPLGWYRSARLAHFLNGYEETGGVEQLLAITGKLSARALETGFWDGSAYELWLCLFFEHRRVRHGGYAPEGEELAHLDGLCAALRAALVALDPQESRALAGKLRVG